MLIKLTKIECIKKEDNFVTEILGIVAPTSSDGKPTQKLLKAKEHPFDLWLKLPDGKEEMIHIETYVNNHTSKQTAYFRLTEPITQNRHYLEQFQVCK